MAKETKGVYPKYLNHRYNLREVIPDLYIGGIYSLYELPNNCAKVILTDVRIVKSEYDMNKMMGIIRDQGPVLYLPIEDTKPIPDYVFNTVWQMYKNTGRMLVMCYAGVSRSVTVTYSILLKLGYSSEEARAICFDQGQDPHYITFGSANDWFIRTS